MRRSKFSGVYSFSAAKVEKGRKAYYFVWEIPDGSWAVQALNAAFKPMAEPERVDANFFSKNFKEEHSILAMPMVTPDLSHFEALAGPPRAPDAPPPAPGLGSPAASAARLPGTAAQERARQQNPPRSVAAAPARTTDTARTEASAVRIYTRQAAPPPDPDQRPDLPPRPEETARGAVWIGTDGEQADEHAAPPEFQADPLTAGDAQVRRAYDLEAARKAKMVESKLRETFRQTLLRLKRPRERQGAMAALRQLAQATENITPVHKHMFRDFGVRLRQNFQPDLALLFTRKTVELAPEDDHAHFNLARILCILGMYDEAAAHVRTAMSVAGQDPLYFKMLVHIRKEKLLHRGKARPSRAR